MPLYPVWRCQNGCCDFVYVTSQVHSPSATIAMKNTQTALGLVISSLSDQNYERSLDCFCLWFRIGQKYTQNLSDLIFDAICGYRLKGSWNNLYRGYPIGHLIPRFVDDVESDPLFAPYTTELRSRFCAEIVQGFFDSNVENMVKNDNFVLFHAEVNLIAHCVNLGYIEEDIIRDYILQSLISHSKLHDHQADALVILFKIAGATFGAYVDPAVVDHCFQLLKNYNYKQNTYGRPAGVVHVGMFSAQKRWN